jgi:hypothetical protein
MKHCAANRKRWLSALPNIKLSDFTRSSIYIVYIYDICRLRVNARIWYKIYCTKFKAMRISRQPSPLQIMIHQNSRIMWNNDTCLGSMITDDAKYTLGIKFRISLEQQVSTRRRHFDLNLRKECVQP